MWAAVTAGKPKDVARSTGDSVATVYRRRASGEGIELAFGQHVRMLSRGKDTSGAPPLTAARIEHRAGIMEGQSIPWMIRQFHVLRDDLIPEAVKAAEVASRSGTLEDEIAARQNIIAHNIDFCAICDVLKEAGLDGRDFNRFGHKIR